MRYRVDYRNGSYVSYDEKDSKKAFEILKEDDQAIRIRLCKDIHDEGTVLSGAPIYIDLTSIIKN